MGTNLQRIAMEAEKRLKFLLVAVNFQVRLYLFGDRYERLDSLISDFESSKVIQFIFVDFTIKDDPRAAIWPLLGDVDP